MANPGIQQVDNFKAPSASGLVQAGRLVVVEALAGPPAGLSVRLLGAGEVLPAAPVVVVTLEAPIVAALEVLTEEATEGAMEEATGKPKE